MKKPSDSEIQAFQIGLRYAVQVVCRLQTENPDWDAKSLGKMAVSDLSIVRGNQIMAQDALTVRMPVNQERTDG